MALSSVPIGRFKELKHLAPRAGTSFSIDTRRASLRVQEASVAFELESGDLRCRSWSIGQQYRMTCTFVFLVPERKLEIM
jgi:hypothetical protein